MFLSEGDLISKKDLMKQAFSVYYPLEGENYIKVIRLEDVEKAPIIPQRPKGKWIEIFVETPNDPYSYGFKSHKCSKCEYSPLQISNYCPNCGAEMNGGGEDEGDSN